MHNIPMVDLVGQYNKIKPEVDSAIQEILSKASFINGPHVKSFQENLQKYLDVKHVIPCANGTDALQVAMMALNLQPGDEVITTTFTFIATAEVIALLRLTPVLVDIEKDSYNIDPQAIERAITPKTKAIVPVHIFGQCANMEAIMDIARRHNLYVVEDNAQAIGADYTFSDGTVKKAGTIGTIGCTSFFPSKNLGCYGDGGALFTNDDALAEQIRVVVNHGMKVRYYHDYVGVNSRLDTIQAAVLDIKLKHLDEYIKARQEAAAYYDKAFSVTDKIITPKKSYFTTHVYHQYVMVLNGVDRAKLMEHLQSKGISCAIYYPVPLHEQKAYQDPRYKKGDFPISEYLCENVIALPMHTEFTEEQLEYVTSTILDFIG
ncbi:MAG: DegT/DnrJ/EryC1/StrS family aminotransferase [Bacteroidales bacterium]|nr:DegT/DnrJ/EryC1/StrS family aminotransferase [Bacteroidales bacterium]